MGKFKVFCILALMALIAVPAFAEVQNVKVSGDMSARWIIRGTYDLDKNNAEGATATTGGLDNNDDYLMSTAEVQVDADLTDNVSTVLRLANQRDWGEPTDQKATVSTNVYNVIVDLANVTFKEFFYAPLTVTIGRQDLWYGKGFIVGAKQRDPLASISADEYTVINSFDAIKATLDFDPWKVDGVYSLIEEGATNRANDLWLAGVNVGYKFDSYKGEAEAYFFEKHDRTHTQYVSGTSTTDSRVNSVNTWGLRGSFEPIANATIAAEGALQFGRYSVVTTQNSRSRKAAALDVSGDYLFKDVKWTPKLGIEYIYYSGEANTATTDTGTYHGWDMMYRGKFDTAIREFQNLYYATAMRADNVATVTNDQDAGNTNETQVILYGSLKPTNALSVDGRFAFFWMPKAQKYNSGAETRGKSIGSELDLQLNYVYTEDVSFGLLAAWFFPGSYWVGGMDDTATDIVGTVKVAF